MANSILFSRPLLFYPAVTWVDAVLARFVLNALTGVLVMIVLLTIIIIATGTQLVLNLTPVLIAIALALLLGAGIGMLNAALMGLFPAWIQIWAIMTRPLFLMSGIFYIYEDLPQMARAILWYNPLIHITGLTHTGFYPTYAASYVNITYVVVFALIPLFLGTVLMGRYHREILNEN